MGDLKAYLAAKYMSGPKADAILARSSDPTVKKRKKKPKNEDYIGGSSRAAEGSGSGLMLRDEDEERLRRRDEEDDDDAPVVGKDIATFQKSKNAWATVASSTSVPLPPSASAEASASADVDTDMDVKPEPSSPPPPPVQLTKRRGGLRTAAQIQEEAARAAAERSASPPADADGPDPTATVHRDSSGRVIDVAQLQAEERAREAEERRKEAERKEWTKGMTQRREREERARMEKQMAEEDVGRGRDDVRMNREMREVDRWNDPAAAFLTKKKKKGPKRPKYDKAWPPNRFNIPPGFRWDGVDRSNGFEKKFFQAQNTRARREHEHNAWSVEDM